MNSADSMRKEDTSHINWATKFIALIGGVLPAMAMIGVTAVLPQIEADIAVDATDRLLVKLLGPIIGVSMLVGAPLTGFLIDRMGSRRIFVAAAVLYGIAGTAGFYLSNIYAMLASRLLLGFAAAAIITISLTLINRRFEGNERARWMGYNVSMAMVSTLIIHPLLGLLGEFGWRWPFIVYAFGFVVAGVAIFAKGVDAPVKRANAGAQSAALGSKPGNFLRWFPIRYVPLALVMGGVAYMPTVYLPFVARDFGVTSPMVISSIMLADAIIGSTMSYFFGWSQRYLSRYAAFAFSFSCTGAGMLIVAMAGDLTGVVIGMIVFGFGIGWFTPNLLTSISFRVRADQQGRAVGIVKAAHSVSSPAAVIAVEPLTRAMGPTGAIWAGVGLSVIALSLFLYRILARSPGGSLDGPPVAAEGAN